MFLGQIQASQYIVEVFGDGYSYFLGPFAGQPEAVDWIKLNVASTHHVNVVPLVHHAELSNHPFN